MASVCHGKAQPGSMIATRLSVHTRFCFFYCFVVVFFFPRGALSMRLVVQ